MLKALRLTLALAALSLFAASCGTDHAQVRFVHASPDGPNVDVAIDGKTVVTNLAFDTVSPATGYFTVTAGNRRVEVRVTGTTTDLINSTMSFSSGKQFTVIATGFENPAPGTVAALTLTDDNSAPTSGNVKLRVVHAAPSGPPNVDVYIVAPGTDISGMAPTISGLAFGQASAYQTTAPTSNQVIFTAAGDKTPVINQTYTLAAGQIRTLVTVNVQGGTTMATTPLELSDLN
jgi:uncharacterized protein DUF4397